MQQIIWSVINYISPPLWQAAEVAGGVNRRKRVEGISKVDRRLARSVRSMNGGV
jgi:hypothetical protein